MKSIQIHIFFWSEYEKIWTRKDFLFGLFSYSGKTKDGENVTTLEVGEVARVECNLADNQYQQKYNILCTTAHNKSYACLLNVQPNNLMFLKTYNTMLPDIIITFTN